MRLSFLKYKTNLVLKKRRATPPSISYKSASSVGIVFTVEDKQKHFAIKEFIKKIESDGKNVQVLEYLPEHTENYEFKFDFFTQKEVSIWGNISSASAMEFVDAPFDFLFYLDLEPNPLINHLLALSHAKCRVGRYWDDGNKFLDLMVQQVSNTQALLDSIYKYTSQLR
jgi:hypothetical protein